MQKIEGNLIVTNPPLISIIMPVYNAAKLMPDALGSVKEQTYRNFELIIINDGSSDGHLDVVNKFKDQYSIVYLDRSHKGVSMARNAGMEVMKGDFFCFLDADDMLPPNSLKSRMDVFKKDRNIHFVDGAVAKMDARMQEQLGLWRPSARGNVKECLYCLSEECFFGLSWMIKRSREEYRFREGLTHGEDLMFYVDICEDGLYDYTEEVVLKYRVSDGSAMGNIDGLAKGYEYIYREISRMDEVPSEVKEKLRLKIRKILTRSFLKKGRLHRAAESYIKYTAT